ncbi:chromate transporter [Bradyrhizobium sp. USDA 4454]
MSSESNPIAALIWTFGLMSLFAVGGANSAILEMHRAAVDVHHWLTDKQFADVFAISQLAGTEHADRDADRLFCRRRRWGLGGDGRDVRADAVLAYYVSRSLDRSRDARRPAVIEAALVPLSIGLMAASGLIVARTSDQSWIAIIVAAALAFAARINPLWMLLAGRLLGFAGVV